MQEPKPLNRANSNIQRRPSDASADIQNCSSHELSASFTPLYIYIYIQYRLRTSIGLRTPRSSRALSRRPQGSDDHCDDHWSDDHSSLVRIVCPKELSSLPMCVSGIMKSSVVYVIFNTLRDPPL